MSNSQDNTILHGTFFRILPDGVKTADELNLFISSRFKCNKILVFISRNKFNSLENREKLNLLADEDTESDPLDSDIIYALYDADIIKEELIISTDTLEIIARVTEMWNELEPSNQTYSSVVFEDM